ncbi:MAG: SDR family NAD(P)-dependent oxidoreductase [Dehalococcoidales bacterium]|nr:SDR family NAD(P)-dependent oxidoreductase [Dehalococcoidales bacterium]
MEFKDKNALITGSSSGIGKAAAIALAKEGANIILASRNVANLETVKKEIEALGREAVAIECDVSKDESVVAMRDKALEAFNNIDILINNAGVGMRGLLEDVSLDDWRYIINTNLMGYIRVIQAFLPHFLKRGSGYIVTVSSIQAMMFGSEMLNTPYVTTKAGIIGLTDCLAQTLRSKGIKVSCLIPGGVITEIAANSRFVGSPERVKELRATDVHMTRGPQFLTAEQCAEGLLEGMKREDYLILTPPGMAERLKAQGRDVAMFNAFVANPPPPIMPPPKK